MLAEDAKLNPGQIEAVGAGALLQYRIKDEGSFKVRWDSAAST